MVPEAGSLQWGLPPFLPGGVSQKCPLAAALVRLPGQGTQLHGGSIRRGKEQHESGLFGLFFFFFFFFSF